MPRDRTSDQKDPGTSRGPLSLSRNPRRAHPNAYPDQGKRVKIDSAYIPRRVAHGCFRWPVTAPGTQPTARRNPSSEAGFEVESGRAPGARTRNLRIKSTDDLSSRTFHVARRGGVTCVELPRTDWNCNSNCN